VAAGPEPEGDRPAAGAGREDGAPLPAGGGVAGPAAGGWPGEADGRAVRAGAVGAGVPAVAAAWGRVGDVREAPGADRAAGIAWGRAAHQGGEAAAPAGDRDPVRDVVPVCPGGAGLRAAGGDDPGGGRGAGGGDPGGHGVGGPPGPGRAPGEGRARPSEAAEVLHLHAGGVALPVRLPDRAGDDEGSDRGVRGGLGVLRGCVPGAPAGQHEGDRGHGGPAGPADRRGLPRVQPGPGIRGRPGAGAASAGQGPVRADGAARAGRLLRGGGAADDRGGAGARAAVVPGGGRSPAARDDAADAAGALRGGGEGSAAPGAGGAVRRAVLEAAEGDAGPARAGAGGALLAAAGVRGGAAGGAGGQPAGPLLRRGEAGEDASPAGEGGAVDRPGGLSAGAVRLCPAGRGLPGEACERVRRSGGPGGRGAAGRAAPLDPDAACPRAAAARPEVRAGATGGGLPAGAGGGDARRPAPGTDPRAGARGAVVRVRGNDLSRAGAFPAAAVAVRPGSPEERRER